jgi:hypothetical protein
LLPKRSGRDVQSTPAAGPAVEPRPDRRRRNGADATKTGNDMAERGAERNKDATERNLGEQGRQGNVEQNTTHQGYQQDR